jgi:hypothetical protein
MRFLFAYGRVLAFFAVESLTAKVAKKGLNQNAGPNPE